MKFIEKYFTANDKLKKIRILCIGDVILDKFISGTVDRVSPEAPIPVLNTKKEKYIVGGVGNVVANISSLGASAEIITSTGKDIEGSIINQLIGDLKNTKAKIFVDRNKISTTKERYVSGSQHLLRVDRESKRNIDKKLENRILNYFAKKINSYDAVVLSDYGKGLLTKNLTKKIIANTRKNNIPVIIDPNGRDYTKYAGCTVITPNKLELSFAANMSCQNDLEINKAARKIKTENNIDYILVTRSEEGMTLFESSRKITNLKSEAKEIYDVSGAGDTVVAVLAISLGAGSDIISAAKISNFAAGEVISKFGTSTVEKSDLIKYFSKGRITGKVSNLSNALKIISGWKKNKLSIGFTNGAFDVFHEGHLSSLHFSKNNCEKLIVGLNSDVSVRNLKGNDRPINNQKFRSEILASLDLVDLVIIFNSKNPLDIIKKISPDYLFKGSDYNIEKVVGRKFVEGYGGKVLLTPYLKGQSSSNIISKIRAGK